MELVSLLLSALISSLRFEPAPRSSIYRIHSQLLTSHDMINALEKTYPCLWEWVLVDGGKRQH